MARSQRQKNPTSNSLINILFAAGMSLDDISHLVNLNKTTVRKRISDTEFVERPKFSSREVFSHVFRLYAETNQTTREGKDDIFEACEKWLKITIALSMVHGAVLAMQLLEKINSTDSIALTHNYWNQYC